MHGSLKDGQYPGVLLRRLRGNSSRNPAWEHPKQETPSPPPNLCTTCQPRDCLPMTLFRHHVIRMFLLVVFSAAAWPCASPAHAHGDLQPRIEALTAQIQGHPRDATLFLQRGELHRLDADAAAALADYDRAERLDPRLAAVHFWRGVALRQFAWPEHARDSLD